MLCRFLALLPHDFELPEGAALPTQTLEIDGYRVVVRPPGYAAIDRHQLNDLSFPLSQVMKDLALTTAPVDPAVTINGGKATKANVLVIDFYAETFNRRADGSPDDVDPPLDLVYQVANGFLARLRVLLRAPYLKEMETSSVPSKLIYLNDDGSALEAEKGEVRAHVVGSFQTTLATLTEAGWTAVESLPWDYQLPLWDRLLLDSASLLPEVSASVVVASAALESFADWALEQLVARGAMNKDLYKWIAERDGQLERQPSFADQYNHLWRALTGTSLQDNADLWQGFNAIKGARNAIAHGAIPKENGEPITSARANELVGFASRIIDWGEAFLPEEVRRPKVVSTDTVSMERIMIAPESPTEGEAKS